MIRTFATAAVTILFSCMGLGVTPAADLELARAGSTRYCLVVSADASPVTGYAATTLSTYLERITGATFPVRKPADVETAQDCIFVGLCPPALERLEDDAPLADLADQEHVAKSVGGDIFLYGAGIHGDLWAVMDFLHDSLGWRWYSVHEDPVVPSHSTLTLKAFARRRRFTFGHREVQLNFGTDFYYQNGVNIGYARRGGSGQYVSKLPRVCSLKLNREDIVPGQYRLYEIGEVPVTPRSWVYFGRSWQTHLKFGERVYEPGAGNVWELYASLKFDGPSYGGDAREDQVLVGRVIAVSKSPSQFQER